MNKQEKYIILCSLTYDADTHGPAKFIKIINNNWGIPNTNHLIITPDTNGQTQNIYKICRELPRFFGIFWEIIYSYRFHKKLKQLQKKLDIRGIIFTDIKFSLYSLIFIQNIPIIGMLNDNENIDFSKSLNDYKLKTLILKVKSWFFEIIPIILCGKVIVNSIFMRNLLKSKPYGRYLKIYDLYKSIEFESFEKLNLNPIIQNNRINILYAKNEFIRGGLKELLLALNLLTQYKFILTIAGPDGDEFNAFINKLTVHKHIEIIFLGGIPNTELLKLMSENHIFCVPSRREALGLANIEAMYSGIPVVSTKVGGIMETTNNGKHAWLANCNDHINLAETLLLCLNDKDKNQKLINAREFVISNFNHVIMLEKFFNIIRKEFFINEVLP
jgi:colanic acid/amylovoran biosynthesis glycosyltransferase